MLVSIFAIENPNKINKIICNANLIFFLIINNSQNVTFMKTTFDLSFEILSKSAQEINKNFVIRFI